MGNVTVNKTAGNEDNTTTVNSTIGGENSTELPYTTFPPLGTKGKTISCLQVTKIKWYKIPLLNIQFFLIYS